MERTLDKLMKEERGTSFKKQSYDVKYFIENIDKGIENSKSYQFENDKLINEVGTSVFTILDEILKSPYSEVHQSKRIFLSKFKEGWIYLFLRPTAKRIRDLVVKVKVFVFEL